MRRMTSLTNASSLMLLILRACQITRPYSDLYLAHLRQPIHLQTLHIHQTLHFRSPTLPPPLKPSRSIPRSIPAPNILAQTRRQILNPRAPATLVPAQRKHQFLALGEKAVVDPILSVRLAVQRRRLDVNSSVSGVKVFVADGGGFAGQGGGDGDAGEKGRGDQVDALAGVREQAHPALSVSIGGDGRGQRREDAHGHCDEGPHGARVVIAG
jgi:hypothetical protein